MDLPGLAEIEACKEMALSGMMAQEHEFCVGAMESAAARADMDRVEAVFDAFAAFVAATEDVGEPR